MKIFFSSLLFILVVVIFTVVADRFRPDGKETNTVAITSDRPMPMDDKDFLFEMIEHHQGAIAMAKEVLIKSNRQELRDFASQIIVAQSKEIDQMYTWRQDWYKDTSHVAMRMGHDMPSMAIELGENDDTFDFRFLNAMISHHQGAIDMANRVLQQSNSSDIRGLASSIITDQSKEIEMMNDWKSEWYSK